MIDMEPLMALNPHMPTCYICGRQYGHSSLKIHEPQCLERWHRENSELPRHLQRSAPVPPQDFQAVVPPRRSRENFYQPHDCAPLGQSPFREAYFPPGQRDFIDAPIARSHPGPNPIGKVRIGYINGSEYGMDTYEVYRPNDYGRHSAPTVQHTREDRYYGPRRHEQWHHDPVPQTHHMTPSYNYRGPANMEVMHMRLPQDRYDYRSVEPPLSYTERLPPPGRFSYHTEAQLDRMAYDRFQANLVPCHNCGRRFRPDLIPSHTQNCVDHPEIFLRH
ncbi:zinc finger protein 474-like isoform X1 [Paramacrobiotus metropolitanus]|uniref:zinc finger protein 474-like isoform X1 n=1 Tax=Paramacrobiotus metropolitanus TaxID=2943436 RepID=UPI00244621FF|nr:zinc finger protein 474-like isoform X1 [Paramacrobiotus metropolitanus]